MFVAAGELLNYVNLVDESKYHQWATYIVPLRREHCLGLVAEFCAFCRRAINPCVF